MNATMEANVEATAVEILTLEPTANERPANEHPVHEYCQILQSRWQEFVAAMKEKLKDESAMSTVEYCLGAVAAAALGALLYTVVTSDTVQQALEDIFQRALEQGNR